MQGGERNLKSEEQNENIKMDIESKIKQKVENQYLGKINSSPIDQNISDNESIDWKCPEEKCLIYMASLKLLNKHLLEVHAKKNYNCEVCDNKFADQDLMNQHMKKVHVNGKKQNRLNNEVPPTVKHICLACSKEFNRKNNLTKHLAQKHNNSQTHCRERMFKCSHCDKRYASYKDLDIHMKSGHMSLQNPVKKNILFSCGECALQSSSSRYINIHRKGHIEYKKWEKANMSQLASMTE